jgi:mitochondrial import receptor subunit TOM70
VADLRRQADAAVQSDDYEVAAGLYTRAIAAAIADGSMESSLYTNRAWCYANMLPPRHDEVVKDCDAAIAMDPLNAMAILRRSVALQGLKESTAGNR